MGEGFWRWGERDRVSDRLIMGGRKGLTPVAIALILIMCVAIQCVAAEAELQSSSLAEKIKDVTVPEDAFPAGSKAAPAASSTPAKPLPNRIQRRLREPSALSKSRTLAPREPAAKLLPEAFGKRRVKDEGTALQTPETQPAGARPPPEKEKRLRDFAPYGRVVKCELVFTVDSLNLSTPIVGLVTDDVWWNGRLIIPAGTEVFSKAIPNRVLNRIGDDGVWTFVLPKQGQKLNGRELVVRGSALDRAEVGGASPPQAWSLADGAAGLRGYVVDEADREKVELFLATALGGMVEGFASGMQTRVAAGGAAGLRGASVVQSTLSNAALAGAGKGSADTLELLARQILKEVERNGAYVRVPAGKPFYVFVDQTIDATRAEVGARLPEEGKK